MITAVDTNVLLDILLPNEAFWDGSSSALEFAANAGAVVICDLVYAELCCEFRSREECDRFLSDVTVTVEPLNRDSCFLASRVRLVHKRQGGKRNRILPDFLIGAHAQTQANQLLTRDRGFYRRMFPALRVIDPSKNAIN